MSTTTAAGAFDAVLGNPPYQVFGGATTYTAICILRRELDPKVRSATDIRCTRVRSLDGLVSVAGADP